MLHHSPLVDDTHNLLRPFILIDIGHQVRSTGGSSPVDTTEIIPYHIILDLLKLRMIADAANALGSFINARRRLELRGEAHGVTVYDDFAHHPTAIATTIAGLRRKVGTHAGGRILAVLEPRSNTMKLGVMKAQLPDSLREVDAAFCYAGNLGWDAREALAPMGERAVVEDDIERLVDQVSLTAQPGDHILVMSNGGFGGIHDKLIARLRQGTS